MRGAEGTQRPCKRASSRDGGTQPPACSPSLRGKAVLWGRVAGDELAGRCGAGGAGLGRGMSLAAVPTGRESVPRSPAGSWCSPWLGTGQPALQCGEPGKGDSAPRTPSVLPVLLPRPHPLPRRGLGLEAGGGLLLEVGSRMPLILGLSLARKGGPSAWPISPHFSSPTSRRGMAPEPAA